MKKYAYTRERLSWLQTQEAYSPTAPPVRTALQNLFALLCALLEALANRCAVWRLGIPNVELTIKLHEGPENGKVTYRGLIFFCICLVVFGVGRRLGF